jgi:predicted transcriptional regulator
MTEDAEDQARQALGRELRRIREQVGLSRQQLADQTGIHRNSIERYEAGADVTVTIFIRLCVAMGQECAATLERVFRPN